MTPPALVFDLDGTLVDTAPDLLSATNAVLAHAGRPAIAPLSLRHMVGFGARALIQQAFAATGEPVSDRDLPALFDLFLVHYRANIAVASKPFPNVAATLAGLRAGGARLGVLTNKPQALTELLLPAMALDPYFEAVFGAGRRPYTKPDARIFADVVAAMGGVPSNAIMIGDSATDVATARAANVPVIVVSFGYTPEPAHMLGADRVVDDFAEIPAAANALLKMRS